MSDIKITDDLILKVHTAPDGKVWYLDGDRLPENSGKSVAEFMDSQVVRRADKVRILGVPSNAELALQMYNRKLKDELGSVEVCSPLACETSARREKPEAVLFDLRKFSGLPSMGGWHEFCETDYPSYAIAVNLERKADSGHLLRFLKDHPVWYAVAGIPHLSSLALCRLIGTVLDPRFFIDPEEPDRLSKLEAFLGLDPKIAIVGGKNDTTSKQYFRYQLVLDCWKHDEPGKDTAAALPELFVWKAYYDAGGGWKGDLRAGQKFVQYLRHTWLDALYPRKPWVEPLFAPEHFFNKEGVIWYKRQLNRKR